jgi:NADH-quinone oxidoreductase subunit A
MTNGYLPIVILGGLAGAFAVLSLAASALVGPRKAVKAKFDPYECGIEPVRLPATENFPVKFYVVAMLFIVFDIEVIFLFPWAVAFRRLGLFGLIEMAVFIGLVFVAYVYVWQKGGLDWEGPRRIIDTARPPAGLEALPRAVERGPGEGPVRVEPEPVGERDEASLARGV